ncbi:hypothetical protein FGG08_001756 [Glutinoglossum americanum]|uniref:F-box domain-containing protein n=1 Tax=Glutinoglossum americanum TaxID=1670608 RepID=A0A9P8IGC3_9PEZI|nr:hypothetical protein FGG08_001756 [Glutinoglossum americanum]
MISINSFLDLPDEVIQAILCYVPPVDLPAVQKVSKRLNRLSNEPLLWRYHCKTQFKYWDPSHNIQQKFKQRVASVDWKKLYIHRVVVDRTVTRLIDSILEIQTGRIGKTQQIVDLGYDAKDTLLRHCHAGDEMEDALARRYYSDSVLGCLHRTMAIEQWSKLKFGEDVPLERALGAFDMYLLHDREGDIDEVSEISGGITSSVLTRSPVVPKISALLDALANKFRDQHSGFDELSSREKALELAAFVRENNLTGLRPERAYRDLYNNFIGVALQDEDHPSLPLVSVAIYCCIAERLGVDARPCGFPFHVHAMVYPPEGWTLDGVCINPERTGSGGQLAGKLRGTSPTNGLSPSGSEQDPMYLDPFRSDKETPVSDLKSQLSTIGVTADKHSAFLNGSPASDIVLRTARNIVYSVQESHQQVITGGNRNRDPRPPYNTHALSDMEDAFYAALWASIILSTPLPSDRSHRGLIPIPGRQYLPHIVKHFEHQNPMDVTLVERHIIPLFCDEQRDEQRDNLLETTRVMRAGDVIPKRVVKRDSDAASLRVKYKVGQVFRHRRYGYQGVVTGWDVECDMDQGWILHNRVDRLDKGRHQSFYHVLVEDRSVRYIAEENMEIEQPEWVGELMELAGKHFKRWDKKSGTFISNIRDEYPDD